MLSVATPTGRGAGLRSAVFREKQKRLAIGRCPTVSLTTKRKSRDAAKFRKAAGIDPLQPQKMGKLKASSTGGDTFKEIALPWRAKPIGDLEPWLRRPDATAP